MENIKAKMRTTKSRQNQAYDSIVFTKILDGASSEEVALAHEEYIKSLNGFDASAFEKTIAHILQSDEKTIGDFSDSFQNIPDYIGRRNNWDTKVREILDMDGSPRDKQGMIDALDRSRTRAHNGVITLFNQMNRYAVANKLALPYPKEYGEFKAEDINHRADVAEILTEHTTVLEETHKLMKERFVETGQTETTRDKLKEMNLTQLLEYAKTHQSTEDAVKELSESAHTDIVH